MNPLIISCAVIGAEVSKDIYPHLPATPEALADEAIKAVKAGASIIHLHCRDENLRPTQNPKIFEKVTKRILNNCECIIQYTTGGAVGTPVKDRCAPLYLKPHMATLSMGTMNFGNEVFENSEAIIKEISSEIQKFSIMPELEIFDFGMIETAKKYMEKKLLPKKFHVDFVLGVPGGMSGTVNNLLYLLEYLKQNFDPNQTWTVAGIGRFQLPLTAHAIALGGNIRVGLEDNIYYRKGEIVKSNAQFVERVVRLAGELERPVASIKEAKQILGIN